MPEAQPPPELNIPHSQHTVDVSIIDTTGYVSNLPIEAFMKPSIPGYDLMEDVPCYSFLVEHNNPEAKSKYDHLLFDLGVRKDWENGPKAVVDQVKGGGFKVEVEKNVVDILRDNEDDPQNAGRQDHTGDPSTFPPSTDLIVGPGFKDRFGAAYPTITDSPVHASAWKDRNLREIDFDTESQALMLGPFRALDLYGDGSFYLIDSPGHATGHMCGLARTSADPPQFIIMGGDIAHHGGEFRPTQWLPLPGDVQPNPLVAPYAKNTPVCPGSLFEAIHPKRSSTEPFMQAEGPFHEDAKLVKESIAKWEEFDAQDNVFAVIAHDHTLLDVVEFYPKPANDWKEKGWKEQGRWRFLSDFDTSVETEKVI
ncbi:hypothetical protein LTR65_003321 [Meristemomyces frigidus]